MPFPQKNINNISEKKIEHIYFYFTNNKTLLQTMLIQKYNSRMIYEVFNMI